ncbi:PP2C family protein-serine/threonine phosphatase [Aliikangiella sp. IMCC44653]
MKENNQQKQTQSAQATDVGCVRELNEDSLYSGDNLWLVADGMGGHACGEVASEIATNTIVKEFARHQKIVSAIKKAHKAILDGVEKGVGQAGMGTTVVALANRQHQYEVAWVGDSRAYLWDSNRQKLSQISEDHSLVVRLVKSGLLSPEEAETHPQRHMITQCLGSPELEDVTVDSVISQWKIGQQVLLCSDGLSDDVSEAQISEVLKQNLSNIQRVAKLIQLAKEAGGKDNISVIIVDSPVKQSPSIFSRLKQLFINK